MAIQPVSAVGREDQAEEQYDLLAQSLKKQEESRTTLHEMIQDAKEKANDQREKFKLAKATPRYGDAPLEAYSDPGPLIIDADTKAVTCGGLPGYFAVWPADGVLELASEKEYCARADIESGCEERVIAYLQEQLNYSREVELWHVWLDGDVDHRVRTAEISASELSLEDIRELEQLPVSQEPITNYFYRITGRN